MDTTDVKYRDKSFCIAGTCVTLDSLGGPQVFRRFAQ